MRQMWILDRKGKYSVFCQHGSVSPFLVLRRASDLPPLPYFYSPTTHRNMIRNSKVSFPSGTLAKYNYGRPTSKRNSVSGYIINIWARETTCSWVWHFLIQLTKWQPCGDSQKILLNKSDYLAITGEKDDSSVVLLRAGNSIVAASMWRTKISKSTFILCGFSRFLEWSGAKSPCLHAKPGLPSPRFSAVSKFYLQYTSSSNCNRALLFHLGI